MGIGCIVMWALFRLVISIGTAIQNQVAGPSEGPAARGSGRERVRNKHLRRR